VVDRLVLTNAPTAPDSRVWDLREVRHLLARAGIRGEIEPDFDRALMRAGEAATVVVTGSFHTVGDAMTRLQVSPFGL
jgi:dihydrofolate synthase/folylpolyglutamate synthase